MNGFQNFKNDYEKIAKLGYWEKEEGYKMFSNKTYREFLEKR